MSKQLPPKVRRMTEWLFLSAVFFLPFSKALLEITLAVSFISWFLYKFLAKAPICPERAVLMIVSLFIITSSISAFYSGHPSESARGIVKTIKYALVMLTAIDLFRTPAQFKRLLIVSVISLSIVLFDSIFQCFSGRDVINAFPTHLADQQIRVTGPFKSYGLLASHLIAILPIMIAFIMKTRKTLSLSSMGFGVFLLVAAYVLYKTQSRGSWLALFGSLAVYGVLARNKWFWLALIIAALATLFALPKKVLRHVDMFGQEQSLVERNLLWKRAFAVIKARPLFGCGINTFTKNYPKYAQGKEWDLMKQEAMSGQYAYFGEEEAWRIPGHPNQIPNHYVHNGYLQMAAETGLISLALFLTIIGFSLYSGLQALKRAGPQKKPIVAGIICGLVALLLQALVDTTLNGLQSAVYVWLFLGLLIAINLGKVFDAQ